MKKLYYFTIRIFGIILILHICSPSKAQCIYQQFTLSPSGMVCGAANVVMSGSDPYASYTLKINGVAQTSMNGTGSALNFGNYTQGGTYMVYGARYPCTPQPCAYASVSFASAQPTSGTVTASSTTLCDTRPVTFQVNAGTGFYYHKWYRNGVLIPDAYNSSYTTNLTGNYTVTVSNGCAGTPLTLTCPAVTATPLGNITAISPALETSSIASLPTTFTVSAANAEGYLWTLSQPTAGTIVSGTTSTATISWNPDFVGDVTLTANAFGCGNTQSKAMTLHILPVCGTTYTSRVLQSINYVKETDVRTAGVTTTAAVNSLINGQRNITYTYYDGLNRPVQKVQQQASPNTNRDIVQPITYDEFGRQALTYQPYVASTADGSFKPCALVDQPAFYNPASPGAPNIATTAFPYAEVKFEMSALSRVTEQGEAGDLWQLSGKVGATSPGHTKETDLLFNNDIDYGTDPLTGRRVRKYEVVINTDGSRSLVNNGYYLQGNLDVAVAKNENWVSGRAGTNEEYKDNNGKTILKRSYVLNGSLVQVLSTYFVYDDFGYLCYVLPPGSDPDNMYMNVTTYDNTCYQYWYDARGRQFRKKIPGKGWDFIVYNRLDKVVMTQDANQRNKAPQQWNWIKYDVMGRVAMTGLITNGATAEPNLSTPNTANFNTLQNDFNTTITKLWEKRDNSSPTGYANQALPTGIVDAYFSINGYDDYSAPAGTLPSTLIDSSVRCLEPLTNIF